MLGREDRPPKSCMRGHPGVRDGGDRKRARLPPTNGELPPPLPHGGGPPTHSLAPSPMVSRLLRAFAEVGHLTSP